MPFSILTRLIAAVAASVLTSFLWPTSAQAQAVQVRVTWSNDLTKLLSSPKEKAPLDGKADKGANLTPEEKNKELEKTLLTMPDDLQGPWLALWHKNLVFKLTKEMRVDARQGLTDVLPKRITQFGIENRSPCSVTLLPDEQLTHLSIDGRPHKDGPPAEGWTVGPGKKLNLTTRAQSNLLMQVTLPLGLNGKGATVDMLAGTSWNIIVSPTNSNLKPLKLSVLARYGSLRLKNMQSIYLLCNPEDADKVAEKAFR